VRVKGGLMKIAMLVARICEEVLFIARTTSSQSWSVVHTLHIISSCSFMESELPSCIFCI
jgi:hypothetical protein